MVHLLGGVCALVACAIIKPRKGRFTDDGILEPIPGHSIPFAALGGMILIFGFLAFNAGAQVKYKEIFMASLYYTLDAPRYILIVIMYLCTAKYYQY